MRPHYAAAAIVILMAVAVCAQSDDQLIGTWKMDASRSKFASSSDAPVLALIKYERVGELLRETLSVTNAAGVNTRKIDYAIDGSELVNGSGDERVTAKIVKQDGSIVLQWIDEGGVFTRSIKISADGRTMTIAAHDSNPDLKRTDDVIVFQRQ